MQIERHEIRVFSAVVEAGGFSRAADRLNVSQSAVSQTIANLEHKLDTVLLVRDQKVLELTEAGIRLFRFTQTVLNEEQLALEDIGLIRRGGLSTLSLAMNSMVNRFYAKDLLLDFCERNPLTRLKLDVAPSKDIIYGVDEDRWELGFGPFQTRMPGHFRCYPYFSEQRVLVVHADHPLRGQLLAKPEATLGQTTLLTSYQPKRRAAHGFGISLPASGKSATWSSAWRWRSRVWGCCTCRTGCWPSSTTTYPSRACPSRRSSGAWACITRNTRRCPKVPNVSKRSALRGSARWTADPAGRPGSVPVKWICVTEHTVTAARATLFFSAPEDPIPSRFRVGQRRKWTLKRK